MLTGRYIINALFVIFSFQMIVVLFSKIYQLFYLLQMNNNGNLFIRKLLFRPVQVSFTKLEFTLHSFFMDQQHIFVTL